MNNRSDVNRRNHLKRKERQRMGLPGVPQLPDDILAAGNETTDEQERTGALVLEAATWAIHARRQMREDARKPVMPREYATVNIKGGLLCMRTVG